ncbi:LADA_0A07778g1_1 [Lachancea dasiensis]|uniref:LADA_0A07778g1_1 n=1 Tax=Lachancea dasiensis TaxID=1072105 RepID=A0A1G4IQ11_9SACH|nr:LADA_0A07778g1_1 [Lachancea dasiensis]
MFKRFSTPILKPYWPFFVGGVAVYWAVGKAASASAQTSEFINDPRNPRFARGEKPVELK